MNKGIWIRKDYYEYLPDLKKMGFDILFIPSGDYSLYQRGLDAGFEKFIVDVHLFYKDWANVIDRIPADYFYSDEPYLRNVPEIELIFRRDYIEKVRPQAKFVIGDVREILKKSYKPIPGCHYTYTSYTGTWILFGQPIAFGLPNQVPSLKRLYKKTPIAFIWVYGNNKFACYPDEYTSISRFADKINVPQILYNYDPIAQKLNKKEQFKYYEAFLEGKTPGNIFTWTGKFFKDLFKFNFGYE